MFEILIIALFICSIIALSPYSVFAAYTPMVNSGDLSAASGDINTLAIWAVGVVVVIGAISFLASMFK